MKYLSLAVVFLLACGAPCGFRQARSRWYAATGKIDVEHIWTFPKITYFNCGTQPNANGCTDGKDVTIAANHALCEEASLHEMGHVLGMRHIEDKGVMTQYSEDPNHTPCITQYDVKGLCDHVTCRWRKPECYK